MIREPEASSASAQAAMVADPECKLKVGAKALIGNRGYRRFLKTEGEGSRLDTEKVRADEKYRGIWVLRTRESTPVSARAGEDFYAYPRSWGLYVRFRPGETEVRLHARLLPYAAIRASERLKLWGAAGHGTGEVTLKPDHGSGSGAGPGRSLKADIAWTMAALGLRGDVIVPPKEGSGQALAVTSDALWARTSSDKTHELAASDSDVTRFRLGLEGSWHIATTRCSGPTR